MLSRQFLLSITAKCFSSHSNQPQVKKIISFISGFTLIELLICLTILIILLTLTTPSFTSLWRSNQADVYIETLQRAIAMARSTAVSSKEIVSLCPYESTRCGDNWENGIMIFVDRNNDGILGDNENLKEVMNFSPSNSTIKWRASGGRNYLRYSPTGMARQFGRFHICDKDGDSTLARSLVVNRQGRTRVYRDRDHNGVVEDIDGQISDCGT